MMDVLVLNDADPVLPTFTLMPAGLDVMRSPLRPLAVTVSVAVAGGAPCGPTVSVAVLDVPPNVPVIVTGVLDVTVLVAAAKVALVAPAATVTLAGTVAAEVLLLDSVTWAPPVGAPDDNVTVPVEPSPPTTLKGFMLTDNSVGGPVAGCGVKLRVDDHVPAVPAELRPRTRHQTR